MAERYLKSEPYAWPYNGDLRPENTALIVIDMHTDFCGPGGYVDKMGYDLSLTRAPIAAIQNVLRAGRDNHRQAGQGRVLRDGSGHDIAPEKHSKHRVVRYHDGRMRAYHDA